MELKINIIIKKKNVYITYVSPEHAAPREIGDQQVVSQQGHVRQVGSYLADRIDQRIDGPIVGEQRVPFEPVGLL